MTLPNEKRIGFLLILMVRPRIERGITAQLSQEINQLMVAGADHLPPNRCFLYFQSNRLPTFFEAGESGRDLNERGSKC
jgi:hypothetical protein